MNNYSNFDYQKYYSLNNQHSNDQGDRIVGGGFAFPFLLGGVTGAAIAPAFWRPGFGYNRPFYPPYQPFPPYYGPYYR